MRHRQGARVEALEGAAGGGVGEAQPGAHLLPRHAAPLSFGCGRSLLSLAAVTRCCCSLLSLAIVIGYDSDIRAVIRVASEGVASLRVVASLQTAGASAAPRLRRRLAAVAPVRRFPFAAPVWRFHGSAPASVVRFRRVAAAGSVASPPAP